MNRDELTSGHEQSEPAIYQSPTQSRLLTVLAAGLLLIAAVAAIWYLQKNPVRGWDFRNNMWIPARLLISGQSPYQVDLLNELGNAVWMPAIIGFGFPLGWLSFPTASNLWFLVSLIALSTIVALLAMKWRPSIGLVAIVAIMVAAFPPP